MNYLAKCLNLSVILNIELIEPEAHMTQKDYKDENKFKRKK